MQYYDITIPAGGARVLNAPGTMMRYYSGAAGGADETIIVRPNTGAGGVLLKPGQTVRLPAKTDTWTIQNFANAATITGRVVVGLGSFEDDRITGEVSVIDGAAARSKAGIAYWATDLSGPVAGQYSHVQLWNPAGSGKNVIVSEMGFSCSVAGVVNLRSYNAALTTLGNVQAPKMVGGPASVAQARDQTNASILGGTIASFEVAALSTFSQKLIDPIILPPGQGLVVVGTTVNIVVRASWQYYEESV